MLEFEVANVHECPPGGWHYVQPESGRVFESYDYSTWINQIRDHRLANGYPISADWELELQNDLCRRHPEWGNVVCHRLDGKSFPRRLSFSATLSFLNMLGQWVKKGAHFVTQEEAERRANICATCPMNVPIAFGCAVCYSQVQEVIAWLGGQTKTERDDQLGICGICSCSLKPSVHFPLEAQQANLTDEMKEQFKSLGYCWKAENL